MSLCSIQVRVGRPRSDESAQLTDKVLDTAMRLFAERGYEATSIAAIAGEARVGKHTIYRRYPDKASLFRACVDRTMLTIVEARAGEDGESGGPLDRLKAIVLRAAQVAVDPQMVALYRMSIAEALRFPEIASIFSDPARDPLIARCAQLVGEAQEQGAIRPEDPWQLAELLIEMTAGILMQWCVVGRDTGPDDVAPWVECSWRLFLEGAAPR
ncbi:TetR/AcrR family transcriptional regulator [Erythrobacter sp. NE805]|uniref:TetR/AcrR family transcriptional regulator n=1 Tax=Erythrobacter sp. NE805 TaxID=3389875 RepID=UPI00396B2E4E